MNFSPKVQFDTKEASDRLSFRVGGVFRAPESISEEKTRIHQVVLELLPKNYRCDPLKRPKGPLIQQLTEDTPSAMP